MQTQEEHSESVSLRDGESGYLGGTSEQQLGGHIVERDDERDWHGEKEQECH